MGMYAVKFEHVFNFLFVTSFILFNLGISCLIMLILV